MSSKEERHYHHHHRTSHKSSKKLKKSSDYDRDRSEGKKREGEDERRGRKRGGDEREKKLRSRSNSPKEKMDEKTLEKTNSSQSEDIPGYESMSAADRLRAKVKLLIDKSETTPTYPSLPDIGQVHQIEQDDFTPQQFTSKRQERHNKDNEPLSHDSAMFGKSTSLTAESEPSLRLPLIMKALEVPIINSNSFSEKERAQKWADKLKLLRTKYSRNLK